MESIPQDWPQWRAQWEYSHAVRFLLQLAAFGLLLSSVLSDSAKTSRPLPR
jgi:hypothetical protein